MLLEVCILIIIFIMQLIQKWNRNIISLINICSPWNCVTLSLLFLLRFFYAIIIIFLTCHWAQSNQNIYIIYTSSVYYVIPVLHNIAELL